LSLGISRKRILFARGETSRLKRRGHQVSIWLFFTLDRFACIYRNLRNRQNFRQNVSSLRNF
jgi:hypothetical protein